MSEIKRPDLQIFLSTPILGRRQHDIKVILECGTIAGAWRLVSAGLAAVYKPHRSQVLEQSQVEAAVAGWVVWFTLERVTCLTFFV